MIKVKTVLYCDFCDANLYGYETEGKPMIRETRQLAQDNFGFVYRKRGHIMVDVCEDCAEKMD